MNNSQNFHQNTVLITGATSGIGKACAQIFAQQQYKLILTGRRNELLDTLRKELQSQYGVEILTLNFDVRNWEEVQKHLGGLTDDWKEIDVLINNAGLASGFGSIDQGDTNDWDAMIDTNVKGLLYVTKVVTPYMIARKSGHIINIASIAGKEVYLNGNVYCASKHAVDALSKAMRIDLLPHHIKVTNIAPGMVDTEFSLVRFHGDQEKADAVYRDFEPLHAQDIAEVIWFAINRPSHVNLNDIVIMPSVQANTSHLLREVKS
ncbi:MAG: SDR family NAD(P)-dependent oxidoreductase [Flavobacteriaceae bacterium]|nr:SDR family NAD(P)-dependent oxidoreductase [Flavobacteriaceae bacterium]